MNVYCNFSLEEALDRELTMARFYLKTNQMDAVKSSLEGMLQWFVDEEAKKVKP